LQYEAIVDQKVKILMLEMHKVILKKLLQETWKQYQTCLNIAMTI